MDWKSRIKDSPLSKVLPSLKDGEPKPRPAGSAISFSLTLINPNQNQENSEKGNEQSPINTSKIGDIRGI